MKTNLFIKILLLLLISAVLSSCNITILGITDDYKKTTDAEKALIHDFEEGMTLKEGNIYKINAQQLKTALKKYPKSLVYCFTNGCSSERCLPMRSYINWAEDNGYQLFLVMNGFGSLNTTLIQKAPTPYFAIDSEYYKTKNRTKYTRRFTEELLSQKRKIEDGNLYFFIGDTLDKIERELPQEKSSFMMEAL